jgi:hypothetical protein
MRQWRMPTPPGPAACHARCSAGTSGRISRASTPESSRWSVLSPASSWDVRFRDDLAETTPPEPGGLAALRELMQRTERAHGARTTE